MTSPAGRRPRRPTGGTRLLRLAIGVTFVPAGAIKFLAFSWETEQFERFGLPVPEAWVLAAGVIELAGAFLLLRDRLVVPASIVLAATMVVAIAVSGIGEGDVVPSLTIAPLLLAGCVVLVLRVSSVREVRHGVS